MSCELTPTAGAFSAVLTALVGSTINGLTSGYLVAYMTGWISWLAFFRILHGGVYMLYRGLTQSWVLEVGRDDRVDRPDGDDGIPLTTTSGGIDNQTEDQAMKRPRYTLLETLWPTQPHKYEPAPRLSRQRYRKCFAAKSSPLNRDVTVLGWFGWLYSGLLAPTTQCLWLAAHVHRSDDGATKLVKGLSVAVSALSLCIDCRARYGVALGRRCGVAWLRYVFDITNAVSCLLQAGISATLLIMGVLTVNKRTGRDNPSVGSGVPTALLVIYPINSLLWMYGSLAVVPTRDGGRKRAGQAHWAGYLVDVGVGIGAGIFVAAPAFLLFRNTAFHASSGGSSSSGYEDLKRFLACESVSMWRKVAAAMP